MATILGIDPGSRITGFGLIQTDGRQHKYIASGCIVVRGDTLAQKLQTIFSEIEGIVSTYSPTVAAIEEVFMHTNPKSAIKLGQARGVAIVACAAHLVSVSEYSPREIKKAITGYGAASKDQMQKMIKVLLSLKETPPSDAADALAIAICHAHTDTGLIGMKAGRHSRGRLKV